MIGAGGPRMLGLAARHADIWSWYVDERSDMAEFAPRLAALEAACLELTIRIDAATSNDSPTDQGRNEPGDSAGGANHDVEALDRRGTGRPTEDLATSCSRPITGSQSA